MTIPTRLPVARRAALMLASIAIGSSMLVGCGAEVAGTTAAVGAIAANSAKQAQAQQAQAVDKIKAAQDAGVARAASAAD